MSKKKKQKKERYHGLTVVKPTQNYLWVSMQNKHGWSLGLALDNRTVWLTNVRFNDKQQIRKIGRIKVVMFPLKHQ